MESLSTPHGALGTDIKQFVNEDSINLSTPHGTLGTGGSAPEQG